MDAEVGVGAEVEVGTDSPFLLHADGWSTPLATSSTPLASHVDSVFMGGYSSF